MATFPRTESEVLVLAEAMHAGFMANAAVFPAPPVPMMAHGVLKTGFITAQTDLIAAQAAAEEATAIKNDAFDQLVEAMKSNIRYAENKVNFDDDKLKLIGWAEKKKPLLPSPASRDCSKRQGRVKDGYFWIGKLRQMAANPMLIR